MFYKLIMVIFVVLSVSACQEKDADSQKTTPIDKDHFYGPVYNKNTKRVRSIEEIELDRKNKYHKSDKKAEGSEK